MRSIYCIWRCRQSPYSIISLQSTSIIASKIASACVKICCCKLSGNYTVFLLPEDIFVKFGTGLKDIGLLANSAFFLSISAIAAQKNSIAYLQGWLQALKNDMTMIVSACSKAQKAADYILEHNEERSEKSLSSQISPSGRTGTIV